MITKNAIDYCENCGASYIVESDSETWETRGWWSQDCPYGEHEREQFPSEIKTRVKKYHDVLKRGV